MSNNHFVIMAGGVGSRLYPVSTPEHPKQFIDLLGVGKTLIQLTFERFLEIDPEANFWVVTSENYAHFVREQLPGVPEEQILLEPVGRNTAPCIAYAGRKIRMKDPEANVIVTPADAYVPDAKAFARTMKVALEFTAGGGDIVCIGIEPRSPHTGYGYIQALSRGADVPVKVLSFREKPDAPTAQSYLEQGGYFWNAGIFVWNARTIDESIRKYAPQIAGIMDALEPHFCKSTEARALSELFPQCEKISIDYAVMEKSPSVYTVPASWKWSDLGSFEAIEEITGKKILHN